MLCGMDIHNMWMKYYKLSCNNTGLNNMHSHWVSCLTQIHIQITDYDFLGVQEIL